jgi:hypothetical protein
MLAGAGGGAGAGGSVVRASDMYAWLADSWGLALGGSVAPPSCAEHGSFSLCRLAKLAIDDGGPGGSATLRTSILCWLVQQKGGIVVLPLLLFELHMLDSYTPSYAPEYRSYAALVCRCTVLLAWRCSA